MTHIIQNAYNYYNTFYNNLKHLKLHNNIPHKHTLTKNTPSPTSQHLTHHLKILFRKLTIHKLQKPLITTPSPKNKIHSKTKQITLSGQNTKLWQLPSRKQYKWFIGFHD